MYNQKALITANNLNTTAFKQSQDLVQSALLVIDMIERECLDCSDRTLN